MRLTAFPPSRALAPYVELIWMLDGRPTYHHEKVLPNGALELIFNLGSPHKVVDPTDFRRFTLYRKSWVAGLQEKFLIIQATHGSNLVGVRFRPGGGYPFLHFPIAELTNRVVECGDLLTSWASRVRDRLLETDTPQERLPILENALLARIRPDLSDPAVSHAAESLSRSSGRVPIHAMAARLGMTHKTLIRRFRRTVGVAPKTLARIERFQSVIRRMRDRRVADWADEAAAGGYYDQAHLIHDFRELAGATPVEYLRTRDADENHIIVD